MRYLSRLLLAALLVLALAGCASADKNAAATSDPTSTTNSHSAGGVSGANSSMSGMSGMSSSAGQSMSGVAKPVPIRTIATGYWKAMKIVAQEYTPVPFYVDNGTSYSEVKPTKSTSFHLMVMLTDRETGVDLPYATVWTEILKGPKMVFNERQWAMLSRYMGPHYGNNVALPGPGTYTLKLLISAPAAAMHIEYGNMWMGTHTVTSTFTWK